MCPSSKPSLWNRIIPGILVAATGVGAGDLVTASLAGSEVGLVLLWAAVLGALLKWALNEGLARWQMATGTTLLQGWVQKLGGCFFQPAGCLAGGPLYLRRFSSVEEGKRGGISCRKRSQPDKSLSDLSDHPGPCPHSSPLVQCPADPADLCCSRGPVHASPCPDFAIAQQPPGVGGP